MGVDLHNTITEQLEGKPQCRLCTHGQSCVEDWELFKEKALLWWGVVVPNDAFSPRFFINKGGNIISTTLSSDKNNKDLK